MAITVRKDAINSPDAHELRELSETAVVECYQCGKCSAGCPVVDEMDIMPSRVIRLAQLGEYGKILGCQTIWLCASCETCTTRCPREVDIAKIMDALREMSLEKGVAHRRSHEIVAFHRAFLDTVRIFGRMQEFPMVGDYKLRSGKFLQDIFTAPRMFLLGKLHLLPKPMKARKEIREIFRKCGY
jgi:heterodisulfide reductase subunit C